MDWSRSSENHLECRVSLHRGSAAHLRVDRAVVGIRSRLGKLVGELFVRIHHAGLEHAVCAHRRLGNVLTVCPYVLRVILNAKELLMSLISIRSFVFEISARVAALPIRVKSDFDGRLVRSRGLPEIATDLLFAF